MLSKISNFIYVEITSLFNGFGYQNISDFINSSFHPKSLLPTTVVGGTLGILATLVEDLLGMKAVVYCIFVSLLIIEFFTGVRASIREGKRIESRKFGRMIMKIGGYTTIILIVNTLKKEMEVPMIFDEEINIYAWIYYAVVNMIIIQLLISVLENLGRLGYAETNRIVKFLKFKLGKWFKIEESASPIIEEDETPPEGAENL